MHGSDISPAGGACPNVASEARRGVMAALPVILGFVPMALLLGAQAAQKGFSPFQAFLMVSINFAGGSEFVAVQLWSWPPHVLMIVLMTLLLNSRHLLMSATLTPYIRHLPKRRVLPLLFFLCDESWALGLTDAQRRKARGMALSLPFHMGASLALYMTWVFFTALGAFLGPLMGDVQAYGFDMAFTAIFLVLLKGMWRGAAARPWLVSLIAAVVTYKLVDGAWYVAVGALSGMLTAFILARRI